MREITVTKTVVYQMDGDTEDVIKLVLKKHGGQIIPAIKLVRRLYDGIRLGEAKKLVEAVKNDMNGGQ